MAGNFSLMEMTLEDFNDKETAKRTSAIVYLSIVMVFGIPGNLLAIAVYFGTLQRRQGTHWMYIRALAITDFLVCTVAIPFELFQQTHQLTFYSEAGCKFFRAISVHLSLTSSLIIIVMSGNRLRKVCQPLKKQLTLTQGYISIGIVLAIAVLFCWPEGVISGISVEKLDNNLTGYDCSFSDRFGAKEYTTIYSTLLMAIYLACMLALVIIYIIVGREILKRAKFQPSSRNSYECTTSGTNQTIVSQESDEDTIDDKSEAVDTKHVVVDFTKVPELSVTNGNKPQNELKMNNGAKMSKDQRSKSKTNTRKKTSKKVTRIAFAISFCFIVSYLPYVAVKLNASIAKGHFTRTALTDAIFPILARTFVINNIINPVIYGFLDPTFLQHCKLTIRYMLCMKPHN